MTEFEIATMWLEIGNSQNLTGASYFGIFTAFVAATHYVGGKIPTWVLFMIVIPYSLVTFTFFAGSLFYYVSFDHLRAEFLQLPKTDVGPYLAGVIGYEGGPGVIRYILTSVLFSSTYFGSLLFLVSVVIKRNRDGET